MSHAADVSEHPHDHDFDDDDAWIPIGSTDSTALNSEDSSPISADETRDSHTHDDIVWSKSLRSSVEVSRTSSNRSSESSRDDAFSAGADLPGPSMRAFSSRSNSHSNKENASSRDRMPQRTRNDDRESLGSIRRRLETRAKVRENLINHPLDQMGGAFLRHLARELWNQDVNIHIGVSLLIIGLILQIISFVNMFSISLPRVIFLLAVLILSHLYLFRIDERVASVFQSLSSWSFTTEKILQSLECLDAHKLRQFLISLLISITLLEMKAIIFLSNIVIEDGWLVCALASVVISTLLLHCKKIQRMSCGECYAIGILCLYVFAFLVSVIHAKDLRRIATLGGPFLLAAGAVVLSSHSHQQGNDISWLVRPIRHSIRLSLRDVLANVGENVAEDEMLQLAMLRWIVDYWTYRPAGHQNQTNQQQPQSHASSVPSDRPIAEQSNLSSSALPIRNENIAQNAAEVQAIGWEEMHSMLTMTTDQMMGEIQHHQPTQHQQEPSSGNSNANPNSSSPSSANNFDHNNASIGNLKSMLESLNVDARATNAVRSYRQAVEQLPPSRNFAIAVAVVRRCPSFLCLSSWYLDGSWDALPATFVLLPFIILEVVRIKDWIKSCQDAYDMDIASEVLVDGIAVEQSSVLQLPPAMDPMCILLSSDNYCHFRPSSAIQVWINVQSSVVALESGLTAVRCVHTTVLASELAFNVMSLAQLGIEAYDKGWAHALGILACDIFHFHGRAHNDTFAHDRSGQYTSAAVSAVKNSQIIARNVNDLMEDEQGQQVIRVIGDVLAAAVGRGWLWGKELTASEGVGATIQSANAEESISSMKSENSEEEKSQEERTNTEQRPSAHSEPDDSGDLGLKQDESECQGVGNASNDAESQLFELIAEALDQGLISEQEKDAFIEMLLATSNEVAEHSKNSKEGQISTKAEVVDMIKKSLDCLFNDARSKELGGDGEVNAEMKVKNESNIDQEIVEGETSTQEPTQDLKEAASPPVLHDVANDSMARLDKRGVASDLEYESSEQHDTVNQPTSTNITNSDNSHCLFENKVEKVGGPSPKLTANLEENEDEDLWTHIDHESVEGDMGDNKRSSLSNDEANCRELSQNINVSEGRNQDKDVSDQHPSRHDRQGGGDEWIKWVGGSLAVIGAVVGSVALVNGGNGNNREGSERNNTRRDQQQQRSTVYIEELSDGDD